MSHLRTLILRPEFQSAQGSEQGNGSQSTGFVPRGQSGEPQSRSEAPGGGGSDPRQVSPTEGCMEMLPYMLAMIAIFYFLLIRPQQKQDKQRKEMLGALKVGDKVVTTGGIHGKVSSLNEQTVTLNVDAKVKLTFDRQNIGRIGAGEDQAQGKG